MGEPLQFKVSDAYVMELESSRRPNASNEANLEIEVGVVKSSFTELSPRVAVECQYEVTVRESPLEPADDPGLDEAAMSEAPVIALLRARVVVLMDANRAVTEDDVAEGLLDPSHSLALATAHPYLRSHIRYMSTAMSIPSIPIPVGFEQFDEEARGDGGFLPVDAN